MAEAADASSHLYHFTAQKAGMALDLQQKKHINRVIHEASKDSKFLKHAKKNEEKTKLKIRKIKHGKQSLTQRDLVSARLKLEKDIERIEKTVDLQSEIYVVVDMDMFFAAVEIRDNPSLKDIPIAVGGMSMISTTNYVARTFGVRSAMPGFIAIKLCPNLKFIPLDFDKYSKASESVMKILRNYDSNMKSCSLDETYMNITSLVEARLIQCNHRNSREDLAFEIVSEIRAKVYEETKLTCSAGIGTSSMIAKIASDKKKPNGQYCVPFNKGDSVSFIRKLPIRKIPGIGKVTEQVLKQGFDIETIEDLGSNLIYFYQLLSQGTAEHLLRVYYGACGAFFSFDSSQAGRKSISVERTYGNVKSFSAMCKYLQELAEALVSDMKKEGMVGKVLTLKVKCCDYTVRNKQIKLHACVGNDVKQIYNQAIILLKALKVPDARLLGLRISDLTSTSCSKAIKRKRQTFIENAFAKKQTLSKTERDNKLKLCLDNGRITIDLT